MPSSISIISTRNKFRFHPKQIIIVIIIIVI